MKRQYTVVFQEIEDGWMMASVPEVPGAVTQGETLEEARSMIKEAVELLLESYHAAHVNHGGSDPQRRMSMICRRKSNVF